MKIYRVNYKHDQTGYEHSYFISVDDEDLQDVSLHERAEDWLFYKIHRYNDLDDENGDRWHGTFSFTVKEVNRQSDEDIHADIEKLEKEVIKYERWIGEYKEEIAELKKLLETPYYEVD